jgi:hypothetical protein
VIISGTAILLSLLAADVAGSALPARANTAPVVVVSVPDQPSRAMLEAINRLRGEATSVGFSVRVLEARTTPTDTGPLERAAPEGKPAAVVTLSSAVGGVAQHAVDVTFLDWATGKISSVHLAADESAPDPERSDVVVAVRAVEFIRARMADTLARRNATRAPVAAKVPPAQPPVRRRRFELGAGVTVLGTWSGFAPAVSPDIEAAYLVMPWLRLGLSAFGFGSRPDLGAALGRVSIDQRYLGATLALVGPDWHRLAPAFALGLGEHWVVVRGNADLPNQGRTVTLSTLGASVGLGLEVRLVPGLALDARVGSLWLRHPAEVFGDASDLLVTLGRPSWFGTLRARASF